MKTRSLPLARLIYGLTVAGSVALAAAIFAAPYLRGRNSPWGGFFYLIFAPVCHQIAARSFSLAGHPLAVCARCLGIYLGFLCGSLFYPLKGGFSRVRLPGFRLFLAVSTPIVLDTAANVLGLWSSSNALRLAIGFSWGGILPFYFVGGLIDLATRKANIVRRPPSAVQKKRNAKADL